MVGCLIGQTWPLRPSFSTVLMQQSLLDDAYTTSANSSFFINSTQATWAAMMNYMDGLLNGWKSPQICGPLLCLSGAQLGGHCMWCVSVELHGSFISIRHLVTHPSKLHVIKPPHAFTVHPLIFRGCIVTSAKWLQVHPPHFRKKSKKL